MSTVQEIEAAIGQLPLQEQRKLCERLLDRQRAEPPILRKLSALGGKARGLPSDLAANHDHYLHGTVKRSAA